MNIYDSHGILLKIPNYIGLMSNKFDETSGEFPEFYYRTINEEELKRNPILNNQIVLIRPKYPSIITRQIVKFNDEIYEFKA